MTSGLCKSDYSNFNFLAVFFHETETIFKHFSSSMRNRSVMTITANTLASSVGGVGACAYCICGVGGAAECRTTTVIA